MFQSPLRRLCRSKLAALGLAGLLLGSCAGDGTHRGTTADYAAEFKGLEIRRIGNDQIGNREFQNRAISNGLRNLEAQGIGRDRIEDVTVSTSGGEAARSSAFPLLGVNYNYDVWFNVKGCDSPVVYRAGPTGAITTSVDKSGCLGAG